MARHDPALIEAFETNRAAIAASRQDEILRLRAKGADERKALASRMVDEAREQGRSFDMEAYASGCRRIDNEYARREIEEFGLPVGAVCEGRGEQPMKPELRLWGRV